MSEVHGKIIISGQKFKLMLFLPIHKIKIEIYSHIQNHLVTLYAE